MKKLYKFIFSYTCNMNCKYCYQPTHKGIVMDDSIINSVIEEINSIPQSENVHISFFGGEPTLFPDKIFTIMEATKHRKNITYGISTNGTNREVVNKMSDIIGSDVSVLMSNKSELIDIPINSNTMYRIVVTHDNIDNISSEVLKRLSESFMSLEVMFNDHEKWYVDDMQKIEHICRLCLEIKNLYNLSTPIHQISNHSHPCNLVCNANVILPDGTRQMCHRGDFDFSKHKISDNMYRCPDKENCIDNLILLTKIEYIKHIARIKHGNNIVKLSYRNCEST